MKTLNHKDYQGSVEYDGNTLHIKILHINDSISTECDSAAAVQAEFEELVDEYLQTCAEIGREPDKPYRGSFNVRVGPELHKKAAMAAMANGTSLNAWMTETINDKLVKNYVFASEKMLEFSDLFVQRNDRAKLNYASLKMENFSTEMLPVGQDTVEKFYSVKSGSIKGAGRYGH